LKRLGQAIADANHVPVLYGSPEWPRAEWPFGEIVPVTGRSPRKFADAFARIRGDADRVLTLDRVPGCDAYRAGDGVHAAWLERRSALESGWRKWFRPLNRKHAQIAQLEDEIFDPASTTAIIANSRMVRDEIVRLHQYPEERITVVPNGLPESAYFAAPPRDDARMKFGIQPNQFIALFAGSGWERKGLRFAIEAMHRLPRLELWVAGKGRPVGSAPKNVRFLGPRRDIPALLAAADVFLLPTIYDPFSNACLEALAAGIPVLTTAANGCSEVMQPGEDGEVFAQPTDIDAIVEALTKWSEGGRAVEAREAIRTRARRFTIEENTRRVLSVLLESPAPTAPSEPALI